jgi:hypothetical protein
MEDDIKHIDGAAPGKRETRTAVSIVMDDHGFHAAVAHP